jgi:hypothetical protein
VTRAVTVARTIVATIAGTTAGTTATALVLATALAAGACAPKVDPRSPFDVDDPRALREDSERQQANAAAGGREASAGDETAVTAAATPATSTIAAPPAPIPVPPAGGGVRTGRAVGSSCVAAIGAGVASVIQTSWNAALPMSSTFGFGPSESTTDFPEASWPVTIRRGAALIGGERIHLMARVRIR